MLLQSDIQTTFILYTRKASHYIKTVYYFMIYLIRSNYSKRKSIILCYHIYTQLICNVYHISIETKTEGKTPTDQINIRKTSR